MIRLVLFLLLIPTLSFGSAGFIGEECLESGCSGTVGTTTNDSSTDNNINDAFKAYLTKINITCAGQLSTLTVPLADVDTSSSEYILVVYDSDGEAGEPETLLYSSAADYDAATGSNTFVDQVKTINLNVYASHPIWVGFIGENSASKYRILSSTGGTGVYATMGSLAAPDPWLHASDTASSYNRTFWVSYD